MKTLTPEEIKSIAIIHNSAMYCKPGQYAYWIQGSTNHREYVEKDFIQDVFRLQPVYADQILKFYHKRIDMLRHLPI